MPYTIPQRAYELWGDWLKQKPTAQTFRDIVKMESLLSGGPEFARNIYKRTLSMTEDDGIRDVARTMIRVIDYIETGKEAK